MPRVISLHPDYLMSDNPTFKTELQRATVPVVVGLWQAGQMSVGLSGRAFHGSADNGFGTGGWRVPAEGPGVKIVPADGAAKPSGAKFWPRALHVPKPPHGVIGLLPHHPPRGFTWRGECTTRWLTMAKRIHGEWWVRKREL